MKQLDFILKKDLSRRDFIKYCAVTAAAFGLADSVVPRMASALESALSKPPVIWIEGSDCAGCSESFLANLNPGPAEIILDKISLRYHETVMDASGYQAESVLDATYKKGKYVLVVEGAIPTTQEGRYCTVAGETFANLTSRMASKAAAIIAVGACATYGGIPAAGPTGAVGVSAFFNGRMDGKIINLPTCPLKPDHFVSTLLYYLTEHKIPPLDRYLRPTALYGMLIHDNCPRRAHYDAGQFISDWNDPGQKDWCLFRKGCKGPFTYTDCSLHYWNDGANYCIGAGSPCSGCSQPEFYAGFTPLYAEQAGLPVANTAQLNADTAGYILGGAAVVAVGAHAVGRAVSSDKKDNGEGGDGK